MTYLLDLMAILTSFTILWRLVTIKAIPNGAAYVIILLFILQVSPYGLPADFWEAHLAQWFAMPLQLESRCFLCSLSPLGMDTVCPRMVWGAYHLEDSFLIFSVSLVAVWGVLLLPMAYFGIFYL